METVAVRNVLIDAPPGAVWSVLADGRSYDDWVVGTNEILDVDPEWPQVGSNLSYTVGFGPFVLLRDKTTVRICEPESRLELEAHALPLGTARVSVEILPWGDHSVVIIDEHPLRGPSLLLENPVAGLLLILTMRNRRMLTRLAILVRQRGAFSG